MSDEQQKQHHSQVQLENKTEHVLHITLAGGEVVSVPPVGEGLPGQTVSFASAEERERFEQALQTETVQTWIRDQHLVVRGGAGAPSSAQGQPGATTAGQPGAPQSPDLGTSPTSPASKRGRGERE